MSPQRTCLIYLMCFMLVLTSGLLVLGVPQNETPKTSEGGANANQAESKEAFLGLGVTSMPPGLAAQLPDVVNPDRGVMVAEVVGGSPAEKAGMEQFDLIVMYNDQEVYSPEQLVKLVRTDKPGSEVALTYIRGGKEIATKITLGEQSRQRPALLAFPELPSDLPMDLGVPDLRSFRFPMFQFPFDDQAKWTEFESMTISQIEEGRFKAEIKYQHEEQQLERVFEGSRKEIREAVQADKELPEKVKTHLLSGLTEMPNGFWTGNLGERFRAMERELFDWPHRDF